MVSRLPNTVWRGVFVRVLCQVNCAYGIKAASRTA
jgi:hypothetical protein